MNNTPKNLHTRAQGHFNRGQLKEALTIYKKLCRMNSNDIQAWHMAGAIFGMAGEYASAKSCCEKVIVLNPRNHGPHLNLATILMATGNHQEALQHFQHALKLKPDDPQILTNLANLYAQQGQAESAVKHLQQAIQSNPEYPDAYNNLGNLYREKGRFTAAESCFRKALNIKPGYVDALCNLGAALSDQLKFAEAESCYSKALQHAPNNYAALRNLGDLHQSTGEYERAKGCYKNALKLAPTDINTLSALATLHERCGDNDSALELLTPLINARQYDVNSVTTYAKLCSKQNKDETGIQVLSDMLKMHISQNNAIDLHFSLGEVFDHATQYDQAFKHFKIANDLDASRQPAQNHIANLTPIIDFFSTDCVDRLALSNNHSELPIFIVGMPRTGTSLVEQILASHPQVKAGGERGDIFSIIDSIESDIGQASGFPNPLKEIAQNTLNSIASKHLKHISSAADNCTRFTDKTPLHGMHLGFIRQLFPRCRVIICNRNAIDTCLSIYFHRFNAFHGYANRLDLLGTFFNEYYNLMQHWMTTLNLEILPIQYEDLVSDPEQHIRKLIQFCGLDWDNNCLQFHKNKRTVNTPSYDQVRRPMYTNSIHRWKHYEKHLDLLRNTLAP